MVYWSVAIGNREIGPYLRVFSYCKSGLQRPHLFAQKGRALTLVGPSTKTTIHVSYGNDSREVDIDNAFVKDIGAVKSIVAITFTDIRVFPTQCNPVPWSLTEHN